MNKFIKSISCARLLLAIAALSMSGIAMTSNKSVEAVVTAVNKNTAPSSGSFNHWKKFHSVPGKCIVAFPEVPEHVKQTMKLEEDEYDMQYDVYVATELNKQAVFMVLIAQYPPYVNESCSELSLECFLNGVLMQHPNNQLVFADLVDVQGHKGMDFFIKTKGMFFKGRAVMAGSNLYLVAMECEEGHYQEQQFQYFINSFELTKG
jgi:hypothetical protein